MRNRNRWVWAGIALAVALCGALVICGVVAVVLNLDDLRRGIGDRDTITPTVWPQPACTPPACNDDEVYACPDVCPGGCGTICATPTPEL